MQRVILPGSTIGVLGSGQLGRMFALAARRMGYRVHTYSPDDDTPTGQVADVEWAAAYEDLDLVRAFARQVDVITFEFENVPSETTAAAAECTEVRPRGEVLHITQNRLREKNFLRSIGIPLPPFAPVRSASELQVAVQTIGCPAVLKTAGWGYDGKGQVKITDPGQAQAAWEGLYATEGVLEGYVDFAHEASVLGARGMDGSFAHFDLFENVHKNHILDVTLSPGRLPEALTREAVEMARTIMEALCVVGVLCVEFFVTHDGKLLVNELAPRPHNSGHITFDNRMTSQFEQQLRAICGLPLGSTELLRHGAMVNLLGDLWDQGEPDWANVCAMPAAKLHLYGKSEARAGRKMGHINVLADSPEAALATALQARESLRETRT